MGNGTSQSAELRKTGSLMDSRYKKDMQGPKIKYASPQHKVLPGPLPGQKLKNTDNGNILLNGGTISGRKLGKFFTAEDSDAEVLAILNRRSALLDEDDPSLSDHKRYHSDPDIANRSSSLLKNENCSPSKARINKARRKNKAPAPPAATRSSTLPMELENKPMYKRNGGYRRSRDGKLMEREQNAKNLARTKSPAPKPPPGVRNDVNKNSAVVVPPPPPPPPIHSNFTMLPKSSSYEKKSNNVSRLNDLNRMKEEPMDRRRGSRDNRLHQNGRQFNPNFHDDIKAALKKRSSFDNGNSKNQSSITPMKQYYFSGAATEDKVKIENVERKKTDHKMPINKPPQQYYFGANLTDVDASAPEKTRPSQKGKAEEVRRSKHEKETITKAIVQRTFSASDNVETKRIEYGQVPDKNKDEGGRRSRISQVSDDTHSWFNSEMPSTGGKFTSGGYRRARSLSSSSSDGDVGIRIDLKPMLPAKRSQDPPKFSPTQAWRSLSVDSAIRNASNEPSSDETDHVEVRIDRSSRGNVPIRRSTNKSGDSGIFADVDGYDPAHDRHRRYLPQNSSDDDPPIGGSYLQGSKVVKESPHGGRRSNDNSKSFWTPEQDLSDDCDSPVFGEKDSSQHSQNQVMVKVQPKLVTSTAFSSLPYMNYSQYQQMESFPSCVDDSPKSPSEKVREKTRRTARRKSKSSNKLSDNGSSQSSGLQNLKKSMKAALSMNKKQGNDQVDTMNWSLSRSIPSSLNELEFITQREERKSRDPKRHNEKRGYVAAFQEYPELFEDNYRSLPQLNRLEKSGLRQGHVVYLPEYKTVQVQLLSSRRYSRSKDDLSHLDLSIEPTLQDQIARKKEEERRKQWFMSAMEQEMQEKNNEREPEWMNRVEEEFRLKRDREKANIRQQLRILNLEQKRYDLCADDVAANSSDSQEVSTTPPLEHRYRSRSEDGLSRSPYIVESNRHTRSRSYHELREDATGPVSLPIIPPPPKNSLPPLDFFLAKKQLHNDSSSPTSSSQASYPKREPAQSKSFSKWFRKKHTKEEEIRNVHTSERPEPEGCRSSSDECKNVAETNCRNKDAKQSDSKKRTSIYKRLNEIVEREEKLLDQQRSSLNEQPGAPRMIDSYNKMNSAGESLSESDVEVRDYGDEMSSRPRSRQFVGTGKDGSLSSSDDGNVESGFYSSTDRKKQPNELLKRYSEYSGNNYVQRKVPAAYAQPFSPSKGYRPVTFNPMMKS